MYARQKMVFNGYNRLPKAGTGNLPVWPESLPMSRVALLILSIFFLQSAIAETVYKYVDENGNTVFTDEPRKGAEKLDVQPVPTVPALEIPVSAPREPAKPDFKYNKIVIVSPEDQHNFINEVEPIVVQVATSPALRSGDQIQLMLNGAPKGSPSTTTRFTLDSLDRGEYSASVTILDADGKELSSSDSIQFYVKRNSKLMPKPPTPKPKPKPKN